MYTTLKVKDLSLRRSDQFSVNIKLLKVYPGEVFCIVGRNGSGKTSLLECLVGLHPKTRSQVKVLDMVLTDNLFLVRKNIGYIPDDGEWFIRELSAKEYIKLLADTYATKQLSAEQNLKEASRLCSLLKFTQLTSPISSLSHGNKRKVQIIAGLMHRPKLIIIDELHNGLDPSTRNVINHVLNELLDSGSAIIASTHDLVWSTSFGSSIAIMKNGSFTKIGNPSKLDIAQIRKELEK